MRSRFTQLLPLVNASNKALYGNCRPTISPCYTAVTASVTRGFADDANLRQTPLHDFHVENGGQLDPIRKRTACCRFTVSSVALTLYGAVSLQAKWSLSRAGPCQFSTRIASWTPASTAGKTQRCSTSHICVEPASGCVTRIHHPARHLCSTL